MGINFTIGNAKLESDPKDLSACWYVEAKELEEAPKFPNEFLTGSNNFSFSYLSFEDFISKSKIATKIDSPHPGIVAITPELQKEFHNALKKRQKESTKPPGFIPWDAEDGDPICDKYDYILAILIRFDFWITWALKNCEYPAIFNT